MPTINKNIFLFSALLIITSDTYAQQNIVFRGYAALITDSREGPIWVLNNIEDGYSVKLLLTPSSATFAKQSLAIRECIIASGQVKINSFGHPEIANPRLEYCTPERALETLRKVSPGYISIRSDGITIMRMKTGYRITINGQTIGFSEVGEYRGSLSDSIILTHYSVTKNECLIGTGKLKLTTFDGIVNSQDFILNGSSSASGIATYLCGRLSEVNQ